MKLFVEGAQYDPTPEGHTFEDEDRCCGRSQNTDLTFVRSHHIIREESTAQFSRK